MNGCKTQGVNQRRTLSLALALVFFLLAIPVHAKKPKTVLSDDIDPFQIAYNLYFVGNRQVGAYLVVTPEGNILINPTGDAEQVQKSIEALGFKITDTKILLLSNSRDEVASDSAKFIENTHAKFMVMEGDVEAVETSTLKVDRVLHDRDVVKLGGYELLGYKTAGLTQGATSWTMQAMNTGILRNVVILGGITVERGVYLIDLPFHSAAYHGIDEDYKKSFKLLHSLPGEISLSVYPSDFNLNSKLERFHVDHKEIIWVDAQGYQGCIAEHHRVFSNVLAHQKSLLPRPRNDD